jgi:hypothetical protein
MRVPVTDSALRHDCDVCDAKLQRMLRGGLISLWLYKENKSYGVKMYLLYIFPPELHTLMTSLF